MINGKAYCMKKVNKTCSKIIHIIPIILIIILIALSIFNIFIFHNCNFWKINIAQVLTLFIAIIITYYATQRKTDERKIKEQIEKITEKIQNEVSQPNFTKFSTNDNAEEVQKKITMSSRKITNSIDILKNYSKVIDISEDVQYIEKEFKEYKDFVSQKVGDLDYLEKSESHLRKYSDNINSKCDYVIQKLYLLK